MKKKKVDYSLEAILDEAGAGVEKFVEEVFYTSLLAFPMIVEITMSRIIDRVVVLAALCGSYAIFKPQPKRETPPIIYLVPRDRRD